MAATPYDASGPGNSFAFDIYNDGQTLRAAAAAAAAGAAPAPSQVLPGGPCNYTDSMLPRCGCRRFWSRAAVGSGFRGSITAGTVEICMCSHHACFHEDAQPPAGTSQLPPLSAAPNSAGQENQRPRSSREPLSPVQELPWQMPTSFGATMDFNLLDIHASVSNHRIEAPNPPPAVEDITRQADETQMPDTYNSWADLIRTQPSHPPGIPPIPAQCLMSSQQLLTPQHPPSTASSSQARYLRPFAGKGLNTLSGVPKSRTAPPPGSVDGDPTQEHDLNSRRDREATPRASASQARSAAGIDRSAYEKLAETVESHEERLDRLETASFSVVGHDECHDKHDLFDLRVTDLESRVEEVEKMLGDNGSVVSSRRLLRNDGGADDATASVVSVGSSSTELASSRAEVYAQLQQLQAQVSQLQAASLPSYVKPWELEVVFMPFPLKGIWMQANEFPVQRRGSSAADGEWTQLPNTISRATPDPQSPNFSEWPGQAADSNWLLPRAFPSGRVVDQRLKSRGLIKTVMVRGADARSVHLAIHEVFSDVLRVSSLAGTRSDYSPNSPLPEFLGLRQAWVPLRKLHKDSRLRFLTPAEMATPALWDFTFLVSSVVMKATGVHRLYITQPEAYLQAHPLGHQAFESGWTWQKLRELSRVYPDSQTSGGGDVPEADAMEECWSWNDKIDEPRTSVHAPIVSLRHPYIQHLSRRSSTEPSSQQFYTGVSSPILSNGASFLRAQSPLTQRERKGSLPPHVSVRLGSVPPPGASGALASPALSRRRLPSQPASGPTPYERRSSPLVARASPRPSAVVTSSGIPSKRRLGSRSPSLIPDHKRSNTPRWSRTSMSRSPSLAPPNLFERAISERRQTPGLYYHTPYSEAVPDHQFYHRSGSRGPMGLRTNEYDFDDDDADASMEDDDEGSLGGSSPQRQRLEENGHSLFDDEDMNIYDEGDEDDKLDDVEMPQSQQQQQHQYSSSGTGGHRRTVGPINIPVPPNTRPEDIPWRGIEDEGNGENVDPCLTAGTTSSAYNTGSSSFGSSGSFLSRPASQVEDEDATQDEGEDARHDDGDGESVSSQAPSEYSSKPGPWSRVDHVPQREEEILMAAVGAASSGTKRRESLREMTLGSGGMGFRIHEDGTAGDDGVM
ncbi:hypothetical protein QBC42DRAFT_236853 [Cladorrhinum samala]|uniref:Uncharacterized protein n=1 Tax=Cladorrhinum samala TaxID=585594 RepID=A0AAV9HAY4_9PEZI|nr:hypothetical protein QBC42DRAFT_236853 [Cladorrhinum samala]